MVGSYSAGITPDAAVAGNSGSARRRRRHKVGAQVYQHDLIVCHMSACRSTVLGLVIESQYSDQIAVYYTIPQYAAHCPLLRKNQPIGIAQSWNNAVIQTLHSGPSASDGRMKIASNVYVSVRDERKLYGTTQQWSVGYTRHQISYTRLPRQPRQRSAVTGSSGKFHMNGQAYRLHVANGVRRTVHVVCNATMHL
jgi:hypothetical protein